MPPPTRVDAPEQTKLPKIGEKLQKDGEAEVKAKQGAEEKVETATVDVKQESKIHVHRVRRGFCLIYGVSRDRQSGWHMASAHCLNKQCCQIRGSSSMSVITRIIQ